MLPAIGFCIGDEGSSSNKETSSARIVVGFCFILGKWVAAMQSILLLQGEVIG